MAASGWPGGRFRIRFRILGAARIYDRPDFWLVLCRQIRADGRPVVGWSVPGGRGAPTNRGKLDIHGGVALNTNSW
jgi:hypothetical protein